MNLLQDKWITVIRKNGETEKIAPYEITDKIDSNPIIEIITPRPDFKGALYQFLIGLFQTVYSPKSENEWENKFNTPPSPEELKKETDKVAFAFDLFGEKIRFMQDISIKSDDNDEKSLKPIEYLFIDSPGNSTTEKNRDLFIKRNRIEKLCIHCAATALFTMQINAPEGGSGNFTSLRGGGPLTTIIKNSIADAGVWFDIWNNIIQENSFKSRQSVGKNYEFVFPWITNKYYKINGSGNVTTQDLSLLSVFWSNPRRIYMHCIKENGKCDICSNQASAIIKNYIAKNQGINYGDGGWIHPLSPYRNDKESWFCFHPQPGGIIYNNWQTFIYGSKDKDKNAKVIHYFNEHRKFSDEQLKVWTFGYDMDSMTARCWYESLIPIYRISPQYIEKYEAIISSVLQTATQVANNLQAKVKDAWFNESQKPKGDFDYLKISFFKATEAKFYTKARSIRDNLEKEIIFNDNSKDDWLKYLNVESLKIFDIYVEAGSIEYENVQRIVNARQSLISWNFGDKIKKVIGLPVKEKPKKIKGADKK